MTAVTTHDELRLELMAAGQGMRAAVEDPARFAPAHERLVRLALDQVLPHLEADERWLRDAEALPETRLLALAVRSEARAMIAAAHQLVDSTTPCEAAAITRVLHTLLAAHVHHGELLASALERPVNPRRDR